MTVSKSVKKAVKRRRSKRDQALIDKMRAREKESKAREKESKAREKESKAKIDEQAAMLSGTSPIKGVDGKIYKVTLEPADTSDWILLDMDRPYFQTRLDGSPAKFYSKARYLTNALDIHNSLVSADKKGNLDRAVKRTAKKYLMSIRDIYTLFHSP